MPTTSLFFLIENFERNEKFGEWERAQQKIYLAGSEMFRVCTWCAIQCDTSTRTWSFHKTSLGKWNQTEADAEKKNKHFCGDFSSCAVAPYHNCVFSLNFCSFAVLFICSCCIHKTMTAVMNEFIERSERTRCLSYSLCVYWTSFECCFCIWRFC